MGQGRGGERTRETVGHADVLLPYVHVLGYGHCYCCCCCHTCCYYYFYYCYYYYCCYCHYSYWCYWESQGHHRPVYSRKETSGSGVPPH
jgi:hypothetical protein